MSFRQAFGRFGNKLIKTSLKVVDGRLGDVRDDSAMLQTRHKTVFLTPEQCYNKQKSSFLGRKIRLYKEKILPLHRIIFLRLLQQI